MPRAKVGVLVQPQRTTVDEIRAAWRAADRLGVDSIWMWDHFFATDGDAHAAHFEGWSLLAAMAVDTQSAAIGMLVSCIAYRNPDLVADMARTVDHLSGGRTTLGLGAGWYARDFAEYGYVFGSPSERARALADALPRIKMRLAKLDPPPLGQLPLLLGGGGEQVILRLVAEHADAYNFFGPSEAYRSKNGILDDWCHRIGRDPAQIERTLLMNSVDELQSIDDYLAAGATHLILSWPPPFDTGPIERLLESTR